MLLFSELHFKYIRQLNNENKFVTLKARKQEKLMQKVILC